MGIESPTTYGDYYWAMQVEAQSAFDETLEQALYPYISSLFADIPEITELPIGMQKFAGVLSAPPTAGFGDLIKLTGAEFGAEMLKDSLSPFMAILRRATNRRSRETWLTSQQANTLFRQGKIEYDLWQLTVESEGYEDVLGKFLYESQLPYPSIPDLVLYSRYHGDADAPYSELQNWFDVPQRDWPVWKWLGLQRLTTQQVQTLYRRRFISKGELFNQLAQIGWQSSDRENIEQLGWNIPNAMLLVQGDLVQGQPIDQILSDISIADINPEYSQKYLDAVLTKPSTIDLVAYGLRKDPKLTGLDNELRKVGIHPDYFGVYRELAQQIPPVADIITMAVREAFSPDIAARFGQYEDFPPPFEEWAAKKGLSKEWAERYWAAHWSLPSPLQGFEMLHRGVITPDELNLLLRALDIMPFWREKLTKIAYRRVTRVDIRRMYRVGILSESDVYNAYLELGYNERDARRQADFTVKQTLQTLSKFTSSDIVNAYIKRMISKSEARSLLSSIGTRDTDIPFILSTADYKKAWELTENRIAGIRNLYRKKVYDLNKANAELLRLDLPSEQVEVLLEQWYYDVEAEPIRHWTTAQTLSFIKEGLITKDRGVAELKAIGYDDEHINIYLGSIG